MTRRFFRRLRKDNSGVTAIEYALVGGLISIVIITTVSVVGSNVITLFNYISTTMDTVPPP